MKRNTDLLESVLAQITDHPELHKQDWWFTKTDCGTAACFAGWACMLSGLEATTDSYVRDGGRMVWASEKAAQLLGIDEWEACILFDSCNTRNMLELMVKDLVNGDELHDPPFYAKDGE